MSASIDTAEAISIDDAGAGTVVVRRVSPARSTQSATEAAELLQQVVSDWV